jgi:hypothetical protein
MLGAALVTAQIVSGKATRDALFLTSLDISALPAILVATSIASILLVVLNGRAAHRLAPGTLVPTAFAASGLLFCLEWSIRQRIPSVVAAGVYLHISSAAPLLASGFWLIASERFDPRTARRSFGPIAGAGTLGGLLSAVAAERVATVFGAPAMLPVLALLQFASAWTVRRLADHPGSTSMVDTETVERADSPPSSFRVVASAPYLRNLALLVLLGTTGAALVDYLFKARAVETFGRGDHLLRFFAVYYGATSLLTFVVQTTLCRTVLEKCGLAFAASTPSAALLAGSAGALLAPGFSSIAIARGGEAVCRGSLFRAGYELFYTPIPAAEKRSAKSLIDVVFDRLGDAVGGGLVRFAIVSVPAAEGRAILVMAIACCAGAVFASSRLRRGYLGSLESSLVTLSRRAGEADEPATNGWSSTRILESLRASRAARATNRRISPGTIDWAALDTDVQDVLALRSRDRARITHVLLREEGLSAALVPHAIGLLAWEPVAEHAMFALRKVAEEHIGQLIDALLDPNQDFAVRRRLARVFSVCVSQRAASGLLFGLDDPRFDVRYQSARSLVAILDKNPLVQIDSARIYEVVLREVTVGRPVWESRRLLDIAEATEQRAPIDEFVRQRAGDSLAHVFTLLSLVGPREPIQIAFRSLYTNDPYLRGTALEYLEGVLPTMIRQRLWPFLERQASVRPERQRDEVIADLLRSHHSILLNLEELRRRTAAAAIEAV